MICFPCRVPCTTIAYSALKKKKTRIYRNECSPINDLANDPKTMIFLQRIFWCAGCTKLTLKVTSVDGEPICCSQFRNAISRGIAKGSPNTKHFPHFTQCDVSFNM